MDPSIMKLLEEDEDETMHSGADVEAFTAALNRDIGGDNSQSQPSDSDSVALSQGSSYTSTQFATWQASNPDEKAGQQSLQDSENAHPKEQHGTDSRNQQPNIEASQDNNTHQTTEDALDDSEVVNAEKDTQNLNLEGENNQQSMQALTHSESASGSSSQAAYKQGKQVPFAMLFPYIQPQLDKDRAMQLQSLYHKLKKNEISKDGFVKHMRGIIGDQMLKMAVYKFQSQATKGSPTLPGQFPPQSQTSQHQHLLATKGSPTLPGQFPPQSQTSQHQHSQIPTDDSSNLAVENSAQKMHEAENQADLHGTQGSTMPSSSLTAVKQEKDRSPFLVQGLNRQQQQHLHFSQASFPKFANTGNNYSAYSAPNVSSLTTTPTLKQQSDDVQMRQMSAQQNRNAAQLALMKQNPFGDAKRLPGGGSLNIPGASRIQQNSVQWQQNKEHKSIMSSPAITNLKSEPIEHFHEQQQLQRSHLSPFSSVQVEQGNSISESSKDESIQQTTSMKPSNSSSSFMSSQMDTSTLLSSRIPPVTSSPFGLGNNGKTPVKKPSVGQKKPLDSLGSSPPPSGKKQKVSGAFLDQSIEQLNDVTAVSGVNLREEEEQLFSGPKDESRVSEASRRVVQEEEERLLLQRIPLQRKLTEIMAKCGLKNMSNDVERCLSLCVEERIRGLISSLIRLSKQRVDVEKSRHRTIVTSDVREEIMSINRKAREEWEKKQADVEKLQKVNEPEGCIGIDGDKEKDEGRGKSIKANKEEDDKMRTTAANVAARAAVGGDDMLSKWQLMAEQARQKREGGVDVASGSQPGKDVTKKNSLTPTRSSSDHQEAEKRTQSSTVLNPGAVRRGGRNQGIMQARIARSITVKDVIAVLEREPQMSKSTLIYRLYEKARSDASAESS